MKRKEKANVIVAHAGKVNSFFVNLKFRRAVSVDRSGSIILHDLLGGGVIGQMSPSAGQESVLQELSALVLKAAESK